MKPILQFKNEFEFLSKFYPSSFNYNRFCWPTVEHAYQAAKSTSDCICRNIRDAITPGLAKHIGSCITLREDWEQVKVSIMTELVWEKFEQNSKLKDNLLATRDTKLIDGNYRHDNFWGDCFCKKCKDRPGKNMLGHILMEVRKELDVFNPSLHSMAKEQKLREAVFLYIEAKTGLTKCMQTNFKQLCHRCDKYAKCLIYSGYCQAWMNLQESYYVEREDK